MNSSSNLSLIYDYNDENADDNEIGGIKFFLKHFATYFPYTVICSTAILAGIVGNLMVMIAIGISKELRVNSTFMLIFNLALADISVNIVVDTFSVVGVLVGRSYFVRRQLALCYFIGSVCLIACGSSLLTMCLLAFNRYMSMFHASAYKKFFTPNFTLIYSLFTWLAATILNIPNLVGWSDIVYGNQQKINK